MNCTIRAHTRRGPERQRNEDACGIGGTLLYGDDTNRADISITPSDLPFLTTLADGVGGHRDGDIASRLTVENLHKLFHDPDTTFDIEHAITETDRHLKQSAGDARMSSAMASTIVGVTIRPGQCTIFNVGDSPAYIIRKADITKLSTDDVPPGARTGAITQCLGGGPYAPPRAHIVEQDLQSEDILLLLSDGITDVVSEDLLLKIASSKVPGSAENLCQEATRKGGGDDASVVICYF